MKRILITAVAALCLLAGGTVFAQDHPLKAQIPFDFCVGDTVLPAGTYLFGQQPASQCAMVVRNSTTGEAIFNMAKANDYFTPESPGRLIFQRYGDQHFLREIHGQYVSNNMTLPVSAREKKARMELGTVKVYEHVTVPSEKD